MGLLTHQERSALVRLLLDLPNFDDPQVRRLLIISQPAAIRGAIPFSNTAYTDLHAILNVVDGNGAQRNDGSWPIFLLLDEALQISHGLRIEEDLRRLRDVLERRTRGQSGAATSAPPPARSASDPPQQLRLLSGAGYQAGPLAIRLSARLALYSPSELAHPEDILWLAIKEALIEIGAILLDIGRDLNSPSAPDYKSVSQIASFMSEFENDLIELDLWLETQRSMRWSILQRELRTICNDHWNHTIKAKLFVYAEWLKKLVWSSITSATVRQEHEEQRILVGSNLVSFAHELRQAVELAERQPW